MNAKVVFSAMKRAMRRRLARRFGVPEIPFALERLRDNGFVPQHVFDVGAYSGEFAKTCRDVWPSAAITCFEVLPARARELQEWCKEDGNAGLMECLLGAESKSAVSFHEMETASSILEEHIAQTSAVRTFPMQTIDQIVNEGKKSPPDLLKLDVQGYELEVLKGAEQTLPRITAILAEVNLIDIHKGAPLLDELVSFLRERGFVAYDICGLTRRPLDKALWQTDVIFVPHESPLRSDKRWQA